MEYGTRLNEIGTDNYDLIGSFNLITVNKLIMISKIVYINVIRPRTGEGPGPGSSGPLRPEPVQCAVQCSLLKNK